MQATSTKNTRPRLRSAWRAAFTRERAPEYSRRNTLPYQTRAPIPRETIPAAEQCQLKLTTTKNEKLDVSIGTLNEQKKNANKATTVASIKWRTLKWKPKRQYITCFLCSGSTGCAWPPAAGTICRTTPRRTPPPTRPGYRTACRSTFPRRRTAPASTTTRPRWVYLTFALGISIYGCCAGGDDYSHGRFSSSRKWFCSPEILLSHHKIITEYSLYNVR